MSKFDLYSYGIVGLIILLIVSLIIFSKRKKARKPVDIEIIAEDALAQRCVWSRNIHFVFITALAAYTPFFVSDLLYVKLVPHLGAWFSEFETPRATIMALCVYIVWGMYGYFLPRRLLTFVPKVKGFVSQDIFKKRDVMVPYGPGLHASFFWEARDKDSNVPLETFSWSDTVTIPTSTSAVEFEYTVVCRAYMPKLPEFHATDETVLREKFLQIYETFLSVWVNKNIDDEVNGSIEKDIAYIVKNGVHDVNEALKKVFTFKPGERYVPEQDEEKLFAYQHGTLIISTGVNKVKLPDEVQKTRDALAESETIFAGTASILGLKSNELRQRLDGETVSHEQYEAARAVYLSTSGNAKLDFINVTGTAADAVNALIGKHLKGGVQ